MFLVFFPPFSFCNLLYDPISSLLLCVPSSSTTVATLSYGWYVFAFPHS